MCAARKKTNEPDDNPMDQLRAEPTDLEKDEATSQLDLFAWQAEPEDDDDHLEEEVAAEDECDAGWHCPFCFESAQDTECKHLIGVGDNTFPNASGMGAYYDVQGGRSRPHTARMVKLQEALDQLIRLSPTRPELKCSSQLDDLLHATWPKRPRRGNTEPPPRELDKFAGLHGLCRYIEDYWTKFLPGLVRQFEDQDMPCMSSSYTIYFANAEATQMKGVSAAIDQDIRVITQEIKRLQSRAKADAAPTARATPNGAKARGAAKGDGSSDSRSSSDRETRSRR